MSIFDSHCHPQMEQYDSDREEVLGRAREAGVRLICVGTDYNTSKQAIELSQKYNDPNLPEGKRVNMWASVGLHPNDAVSSKQQVASSKDWESLIDQKKVVAIGEVGLDYYRTPEPDKQDEQKNILIQFVDLAVKYNKPIIIHSRDSQKGSAGKVHSDMVSILTTYYQLHTTNLRGVAHSFTGGIDEARKYLDLGFYLGFNGILTFAHQYDEVVKYAPLDRILLETDAPFLSPEPYRGKRNEPARVIEVAKKVAELKGESFEKVIEQTTKNCIKLFNLVI